MDANCINPFIEAVDTVFTTMLHVQPKRNGVRVSQDDENTQDRPGLTSIVGISGQISGVVALRASTGISPLSFRPRRCRRS